MAMWPFGLGKVLDRSFSEHGSDLAVATDTSRRTYEHLGVRAHRLANALRSLGLRPGDSVAVLLTNRIEYPEVDAALAIAGLVRVALNVRLGLDECSFILDDSSARAIVSEEAFDEVVAELSDRRDLIWVRMGSGQIGGTSSYEELIDAASSKRAIEHVSLEAPAWVAYTSGTTGRPKGVVLSNRALLSVSFNLMVELGPIAPGRSILLPQPLSHGAGYFVLPYLSAGATVHIMDRFEPEKVLWLGTENAIDTLKCVPTMLVDLLDLDSQIPFESVIYGAASIPGPQVDRALDRWGAVLVQLYGQSEAPATITVLHKDDHKRPGPQRTSAGRPWRTIDVEVLDEEGHPVAPGELGEVVVRGGHLMTGYLGQPELTSEVLRSGRLWTRDMAVLDENGYIYLRGRRDEMINSGGFNIAPREVEDVVVRHPGVKEAVAMGFPHERWGEAVRVVILRADGSDVGAQEILDFCRGQLGFRRPRSVVFTPDMPRTSYGKIDRSALVGKYAQAEEGDLPT